MIISERKFLKDKIFLALVVVWGGLFLAGYYLRIVGIDTRGVEYDEFWTFSHYANSSVMEIFSDFSTPNNHPLNSFLIKICVSVFGYSPFALRLPSFIAGCLTLITISLSGFILTRSYLVTFAILVLSVFNGALIHFSQTARGYSIQTFFYPYSYSWCLHHFTDIAIRILIIYFSFQVFYLY